MGAASAAQAQHPLAGTCHRGTPCKHVFPGRTRVYSEEQGSGNRIQENEDLMAKGNRRLSSSVVLRVDSPARRRLCAEHGSLKLPPIQGPAWGWCWQGVALLELYGFWQESWKQGAQASVLRRAAPAATFGAEREFCGVCRLRVHERRLHSKLCHGRAAKSQTTQLPPTSTKPSHKQVAFSKGRSEKIPEPR